MSNESNSTPPKNESEKAPNAHFVQKAIEALRSKNNNATCDFCGHKEFLVSPEPVALVCFDVEKNSINLGKQYPSIAVFCKNCGNTKLFNAKALGVL